MFAQIQLIPHENAVQNLIAFCYTWVRKLTNEHRVPMSEIPGFLPPGLALLYHNFGNWPVPYERQWVPPDWTPGLFGAQDRLVPLDRVAFSGRIAFVVENQEVWACETLPHALDPPVSLRIAADSNALSEPTIVCDHLSHFLVSFALQELTIGSPYLACINDFTGDPAQIVEGPLQPLWVNGTYVSERPTHSFYLFRNRILLFQHGPALWIAGHDDSVEGLIVDRRNVTRMQ